MSDGRTRRMPDQTAGRDPAGLRLGLARATLVWEALWPGLWPAAMVAGLFLALALFNVLPMLPGWGHGLVLAALAIVFAAALWLGLRRVRLPDVTAARRRLERDSALAHRPLETVVDRLPPGTDPTLAAVWRIHQERARAQLDRLRLKGPHPNVARRDPFALRAALVLLLFIGAVGSRGDWWDRVHAAVTPDLMGRIAAAPPHLDLWLNPPEYTRLPPQLLRTVADGAEAPTVSVPSGSALLARVTGGSAVPDLTANGAKAPFKRVDSASFQAEATITSGDRVTVGQGPRTLGSWPVTVVPDAPPTITLAQEPKRTERGTLQIDYQAADDYGLVSVTGTIRLQDPGGAIDPSPVELPLALPGVQPREARHSSLNDLTAHVWAGLPVTLTLTARDGAGQTGDSEPAAFVLPERTFNHPVARAIIAQRKELTRGGNAVREEVARALAGISARPWTFFEDSVVFLGLRATVARLFLDRSNEGITSAQALLWDLALRIEEGRLSTVERDLRAAQQALADALDRNASDEEIRQLMDQLQQAMDRFMQALQQELRDMLARGEQLPTMPFDPNAQVFDPQQMQQMMDQMRRMSEAGARDAARQMLSQLQRMMENMRLGQMGQMDQQRMSEGNQLMQDMQRLIQEQQRLMDQTFRQSQQGQRGQQGQQGEGDMAAMQEQLRRQLGEMMRRMSEMNGGEIPQALQRAERAMRGAGQSLQGGQPGQAVPQQGNAIDELQQGLQNFAEQMGQQMMGQQQGDQNGQQSGPNNGPPQIQPFRPNARQNRDPLGRQIPGQGQFDTENVRIPEEAELQRAREILDELRRRSGDLGRPQIERDYIERLLRRFGP
jgi:uncharacterized protein (TIGR02302 family)